jgi:acyl-CoA thioesterase FadM
MKLQFRLFRIMVAAFLRKKNFELDNSSILRFILMPWDCVLTRAGNGRYLAFMDIGRLDLAIRLGWWKIILGKRSCPFVITVHIRYSSSLTMFQRFVLRTRLIHWDKRYIWMEHIFERNRKTVATAISKNIVIGKNGIESTSVIFQLFAHKLKSPMGKEQVMLIDAIGHYLRNIH